MISRILLSLIFSLSFTAHAGPQPTSRPLGSEENQYAFLWKNRADIFGLCLAAEENCELVPSEVEVLKKMVAASKEWKPFRFLLGEEFSAQTKNLIRSVKVPFIAFTPTPGKVVFEQSQMYDAKNKFNYDRKLFLLAAIAAQHGGLTSADADSMIRKLVAAWQVRWLKLDLEPLGEKDLHVLIQFGSKPAISLFDNSAVFDLLGPLKPHLRCSGKALKNLQLGPAAWSTHSKSGSNLFAVVAGKVRVECEDGHAYPLDYSLDLPFQRTPFGWTFIPAQLKVHISSAQ